MSKKTSDEKTRGILFNVPFEGEPDKELDVMAYAFDRRGRLLTSTPFKTTAERVRLSLSESQARHARIFIGPMAAEERPQEAITLETMKKWQAYEAIWQYNPDQVEYHLQPVPELQWHWWPWCSCRVRGQVVRPVEIGGVSYDKPVCHARVHICEVDYIFWVIKKLPDLEIWRLRDDLLHLIEKPIPFPFPLPDPPPFRFDLDEINMAMETVSGLNRPGAEVSFNPQPDPPAELGLMANDSLTGMVSNRINTLPINTRANLTSNSLNIVRQSLLDNISLIIPYLCWLEWFWPLVKCDELAVVETDGNGRFDTTIWYPCFGDKPDLYFWIEYSVGGSWTTVYHPPMRCNTYWNYNCGQEVTLRVTDSRVVWCDPAPRVPGNHLAILGIGENTGFQQIYGPGAGALRGLTNAVAGGTGAGSPFGAVLEPRVYFGEDLIANGITHYRWSYSKVADSNNNPASDSWHAMDRQVIRHYAYTGSDGTLKFKPYTLGPDTDPALTVAGQNLFQIQPEDPPTGSWTPEVSAHENTASAHFETHKLEGGNDHSLAAGKYELRLELFDNGGTRIPFQDGPTTNVQPVVAVGPAPFGADELDTIPAPTDNLVTQSGKVVGFKMIVHVDNTPCQAIIHPVEIGGVEANLCGFLNYDDTADLVKVSFKAYHENDFATFDFQIFRGKVGQVEFADGKVGVGQDGYAELNGEYAKNVPVSYLMRPNAPVLLPCIRAAFAETLEVKAMATNGWTRLSGLDRSGMPLAFALAPSTD